MIPTRSWVLVIGSAGAVFAAAHAYAFRTIGGSVSTGPENVSERLTFFAGEPALFLVWIFSAALLSIALIAMLPAMWHALGRGWPATAVVGLVLVSSAAELVAGGSQFTTLFLATDHASAPDALRPGLEAAAIDVNAAVRLMLLGVAFLPLFVGAVGAAVLSVARRPPGGRWYGLLFLLFWLANGPLPGPAIVYAGLSLILFGAFTFATARALGGETAG